MPAVSIYKEILDWSVSRPPWQQDALRRLVTKEHIDNDDIADLASLCKAKHGLEPPRDHQPLKKGDIPASAAAGNTVSLTHLTHHVGVNALAPDQTIHFGPNLTVVYGDNGAGKSGYARILKRACRARGAEPILGNVISGAVPPPPSASIRYSVGGKPLEFSWRDRPGIDEALSRVSVFDRQCASVYVTKRMDVAFRPMGLDVFDRLAAICEDVRKVLDKERSDLAGQVTQMPNVPPNTKVASLLENLTALTDPEQVHLLGTLSEAELRREDDLRKQIGDLQSHDRQATAKALSLRADRLAALLERLRDATTSLSDSAVRDLFRIKRARNAAKEALDRQASVFESMAVNGIGSDLWLRFWSAAREFFNEAYPSRPYPSRDALCVLCQQRHDDDSFERMQALERHTSSAVQVAYQEVAAAYESASIDIEQIDLGDVAAIDELDIDNAGLADDVRRSHGYLLRRRESVLAALADDDPELSTSFRSIDLAPLSEHIDSLRHRANVIGRPTSNSDLEMMQDELNELEARRLLRDNADVVRAEIRRKQETSVYQQCIEETRTNAITRKSTELTKRVVTGRLIHAFDDELASLGFHQVEVELTEAGGSRGALYHKLALTRAPKADLAEVVSECEARCLSIASFFAELSTADDQSAILFDDPVSSLDHTWRHNVAARLARESTIRQVIVFTHDLVFLHALGDEAGRLGTDVASRYLRRTSLGAGQLSESWPTPALKVSKRVSSLKDRWQTAKVSFRKGEQDEYERIGGEIYGLLREAWERGVEEILLGGVVERYRQSVQTQGRIMDLSDIGRADCEAVQNGMSKCSTFMHGHDQSPADNRPFPEPGEVREDIDALDTWIASIRKRRR